MKSITQDVTSLNEQIGMTPEMILGGEIPEFEPEKKLNPRKNQYILFDFAHKLIDAYHADLLQAYRMIEELEGKVSELEGAVEEYSTAAEQATGQVRKVLKGEAEFQQAEKLLAQVESQLERLAKDKRADKAMIDELQAQVNELVHLRDTVPQLEADVNQVLENLRMYMEEEGIDVDDYEDEDDL